MNEAQMEGAQNFIDEHTEGVLIPEAELNLIQVQIGKLKGDLIQTNKRIDKMWSVVEGLVKRHSDGTTN